MNRTVNVNRASIQKKKCEIEPHVIDNMRKSYVNLWSLGEKEKAWQLLLKVLELNPCDHSAVHMCIENLTELGRYEDTLKLCAEYLNYQPDDEEIKRIIENTNNKIRANQLDNRKLSQRRYELKKIANPFYAICPDETHLSSCMKWLVKAQNANIGGGVSAAYHMDSQRWNVDYPETTGYIIPTFLCYSVLTGIEAYRNRAIEMGDWEIEIQSPEGGAGEPVGLYGLRPRIFNTAQVVLGWVALYVSSGQNKYIAAAKKSADWIVENQDPDGKWTKSTYAGPKAYMSRVAWALLSLYEVTKEKKYQVAADRSINWILSQAQDNGWFRNNSLSEQGKPWTHLIAYALVGLMESYRLNVNHPQYKKAINLLQSAANGISDAYISLKESAGENFTTLPATFNCNWYSTDNWSCLTGNAQTAFFLRRMITYKDKEKFTSAADQLLNDLKQRHMLQDETDGNIPGGLPGSFPIDGPYSRYSIPSWGVKFFADSLLQRMLPEYEQKYLG